MRGISLRWRWAAFLAAGLHLVPVAMIVWQNGETSGAQLPGHAGIEMALGPAGRAPGNPNPQPEPVPDPERSPEPEQASELAVPPAPEVVTPIAQAETETIPEVPAQPQPVPPVVERMPDPSRSTTRVATPSVQKPRKVADTVDSAPPPAAQPPGAGGKSGDRDTNETGNVAAASDSGGGDPGVRADYMAVLRAWLETHKQYPRRAQMRRQEGTALLFFIVDETGKVIAANLRQSSGHAMLDREVTEMLKRAEPLPRIPPEMRQTQLSLLVPVEFYLR